MTALGLGGTKGFGLHVSAPSTLPYVIQASTDLLGWTSVYTNSAGSTADFLDTQATNITQIGRAHV